MRIFLFSDLHAEVTAAKRAAAFAQLARPSVVISAGDTAEDGGHLEAVYAPFRLIGAPVLAVPGNHDQLDGYRSAIRAAGWEDVHEQVREVDAWSFAGYGFPAFDSRFSGPDPMAQADDPGLTALLSRLVALDPSRLILVTHLPPHGTLASLDRHFVDRGSIQLRRWVEAHQPAAVLCGHVHLREVAVDHIGDTLVVNAGPHGWVGSF